MRTLHAGRGWTAAALRRRALTVCLTLAASTTPSHELADCFDDDAQYHQVTHGYCGRSPRVNLDFDPQPCPATQNGTIDTARFGTNNVHLSELARYGISQNDLLDGCKSTYVEVGA